MLLFAGPLHAQDAVVTISKSGTVKQILHEIESQTDYLFVVNAQVDVKRPVHIDAQKKTIREILDQLFAGRGVGYELKGKNIMLSPIKEKPAAEPDRKMISGRVTDVSGTGVAGATVIVKGTPNGTTTVGDGSFSLDLKNAGADAVLQISFIGMKPVEVAVAGASQLNIRLEEDTQLVDAVVVTALGVKREEKALGFNLLRKHAKIEPQRWYYHCDRLGLVVWQDMVNGGGRYNLWFVTYLTNVLQPLVRRLPDAEPLWGLLSRGKASSRETYRKELQATVEALHCHPCIGCWVPFNEGWGQFDAAGAVQAIRTLDDTRLVDEASGWYDQGGGDVCSIHNYFYPLHVKPGKRTVALSEYGGIAWPMPGHEAPGKTYGYGTAKSRADLTARCKKLQLGTVLPQLKKGLSALVYTQLTDVEDEVNGLFTYDRAEIKPDANAVRSVNAALAAEFAKVTR